MSWSGFGLSLGPLWLTKPRECGVGSNSFSPEMEQRQTTMAAPRLSAVDCITIMLPNVSTSSDMLPLPSTLPSVNRPIPILLVMMQMAKTINRKLTHPSYCQLQHRHWSIGSCLNARERKCPAVCWHFDKLPPTSNAQTKTHWWCECRRRPIASFHWTNEMIQCRFCNDGDITINRGLKRWWKIM